MSTEQGGFSSARSKGTPPGAQAAVRFLGLIKGAAVTWVWAALSPSSPYFGCRAARTPSFASAPAGRTRKSYHRRHRRCPPVRTAVLRPERMEAHVAGRRGLSRERRRRAPNGS